MLFSIGLKSPQSYLIFQIVRFSSTIIISILLAKSYLTISDIGKYESFLFYTSALSFFWITGISQVVLSLFNQDSAKNKLVFNAFIYMLALGLIIFFFMAVGNFYSKTSIFKGLGKTDIYLLSTFIIIYPPGFLVEYTLFLNNRFEQLIKYGLISSISLIVVIFIPLYLKVNINYCIYGLFAIASGKIIFLLIFLKNPTSFIIDFDSIRQLFKSSIPLAVNALVAGASAYIDGYIVSRTSDSTSFAIFRYGAREFPIFLLISSSFDTRMIPEFSRKENLEEIFSLIKKKSGQYIRYLFPFAIFLLSISQFVFQFIFNKNFYESYIVFDIYLLLVISRFIFPNTIMIGLQKNRILLIIGILELVINIVFSLIFVYFFGYLGVAYGTVLAYLSEKIMLMVYLKSTLKIQISQYVPLNELIMFSVLMILSFLFKNIMC
jgi:O-antigen/teichoic acid export membrane protein